MVFGKPRTLSVLKQPSLYEGNPGRAKQEHVGIGVVRSLRGYLGNSPRLLSSIYTKPYMTIPNEIIEKAISGGWRPHNGTDYSHHKIQKANKRGGCYLENEGRSTFLDFRHTVVDRTFWQALGKALRWRVEEWHPTQKYPDGESMLWPGYMPYARRFIDLTLQGQSTEEFWKELIH